MCGLCVRVYVFRSRVCIVCVVYDWDVCGLYVGCVCFVCVVCVRIVCWSCVRG